MGNYITKWGTYGSGDGQLNAPYGIAVDGGCNVYVSDFNNSRVQKFDSSGAFLAKWGSVGSGYNQFDRPEGIMVDANGNIYVADHYNNRIMYLEVTPPEVYPVERTIFIVSVVSH